MLRPTVCTQVPDKKKKSPKNKRGLKYINPGFFKYDTEWYLSGTQVTSNEEM